MKFRVACTLGLASTMLLAGTPSAQTPAYGRADGDRIRVRERVVHRTSIRRVTETAQQSFNEDPCRDAGRDDDYYRACDVREESMAAQPLTVDGGRNGGIRVEGWDRNEIRVQAIVTANARSEADAKQLASEVQVQVGGGRVSATGPTTERRQWWSVSYRINVPRRNDLDLNATNGGVSITGVSGTIRFDTTNGGVRLTDLAGDVRGETRNGGLTVVLSGDRWDGTGLDVQTSNGGVTLTIPEGYNADLSTRTVNGGFRTDYPMTIQGELSPRQGITTTLGAGGAPVSVRTTNGGLRIHKK
jgi:hypothetical protein